MQSLKVLEDLPGVSDYFRFARDSVGIMLLDDT